MKNTKKFGRKGKFVDLNNYNSNKNGEKETIPSKPDYTSFSNTFSPDYSEYFQTTNKQNQEYETPLQTLQRLFSNLSEDIVESIYEENDRTFIKAKKCLEEMCGVAEVEAVYEDKNDLQEEENNENYIDINSFTRFKFENDDPFLSEEVKPAKSNTTNLKDIQKKKYQIDVNTILSQQKKAADDYVSVFSCTNDQTPTNKQTETAPIYTENYIEELTLDYYCEVILEFFPKLSRMEIMQKICDYDFDIDKLVLSLFDEKNKTLQQEELSELEVDEISPDFKEEVLTNFYSGDMVKTNNGSNFSAIEETIFSHNLQNKIEKEIKKKNINSKLNSLYSEKDFPFLSDEVKSTVINSSCISDEYFLDKEIKDIKTKSIRDDLTKLYKNFPLTDEFELKWVYYQYMDYNETFKYFKSAGKRKGNLDLDSLRISTNENTQTNNNSNSNPNTNNNTSSNQSDLPSILYKIISEKPSSWKIETNCKNINISEYQTIRRKLIWQAQMAWRSGRHKDATVIMAKARRYKQEINSLLKNKKIDLFMKNNSIMNCINNREDLIDLHGLNYEESKMLLNKKISDINRRKVTGSLDPTKKFVLNVITGVGNHSKDNKSVLLMKIPILLKSMNLGIKVDQDRGTIRVFL